MIEQSEKHIRVSGLAPLLATYPASSELYTKFIATKCESGEPDETPQDFAEAEEASLSVFPADKDGYPVMLGYQVKGFFKEALLNLSDQNGIKQARSKVDNFVFVQPSQIHLYRDGKLIEEADGRLERPLRANVRGTEYASLASSEQILDPWEFTFRICLVDNKGTPRSKAVTWEAIEDALDYGAYKGLLQWRNAGNGRFRWEEIKD